jgi:flagellar L-ring protein precursor FlgH
MSRFVPAAVVSLLWIGLGSGHPVTAQETEPPPSEEGVRPLRESWIADGHRLKEGDIVTVLVDEYILASANKDESASREKDRNLGLTARTTGSTMGGGLTTRNDVGDRQRGESSRQQRFSGEISTRVVGVSPSGMLRVEGTKKLTIDEVEEEVTLRGWLRPQDVSMQNTVESWRLSDAEILYSSNGTLGETGGFWSRILDIIWP